MTWIFLIRSPSIVSRMTAVSRCPANARTTAGPATGFDTSVVVLPK
jgi:hypothetical protein